MSKKPDAFVRRFIEWSYFHGCPIMVENDDGTWKNYYGKKFDWLHRNYKIDNHSHEDYYSRLYAHGTN